MPFFVPRPAILPNESPKELGIRYNLGDVSNSHPIPVRAVRDSD